MDAEERKMIGKEIEAARLARGLTQVKLGELAGARMGAGKPISDYTIRSFENGWHTPQPGKLRAVLDVLGLRPPADDDVLDLSELHPKAREFVMAAAARLSAVDEAEINALLADLYPRLLS